MRDKIALMLENLDDKTKLFNLAREGPSGQDMELVRMKYQNDIFDKLS